MLVKDSILIGSYHMGSRTQQKSFVRTLFCDAEPAELFLSF